LLVLKTTPKARGIVTRPQPSEPRNQGDSSNEPWHLKLYIAGWTPSSVEALRSVKFLEAEYLPAGSIVEVIDLLEHPEAGARDNVLGIPMMVKVSPQPMRRIVGTLNDIEKTLKILGLQQAA
jgi:circadian clock protein KaiB